MFEFNPNNLSINPTITYEDDPFYFELGLCHARLGPNSMKLQLQDGEYSSQIKTIMDAVSDKCHRKIILNTNLKVDAMTKFYDIDENEIDRNLLQGVNLKIVVLVKADRIFGNCLTVTLTSGIVLAEVKPRLSIKKPMEIPPELLKELGL